jgi:hypothetical protein
MKMKKGRGRPPSQETLVRRQVIDVLSGTISKEEKLDQERMLCNMAKTEKEILSHYKSYPTIAKSHIFEMASIGDESLQGYEFSIIEQYKGLMNQIQSNRKEGSIENKINSQQTAKKLCEKNRILLSRMRPYGNLSKNHIAKKIHSQWDCIPPELRKEGEEDLLHRGVDVSRSDSKKILSIRTIERYIDLYSTYTKEKVRQASLDKK